MPTIQTILKSEIMRLSRKEIRQQVEPLRKISAGYRRDIAALKRQVAALERTLRSNSKLLSKQRSAPADEPTQPMRFVAKGFRSLRLRLGLSQGAMAKLVGVSPQTIYNWEMKKSAPRREQLKRIGELRGLGKREAAAQLGGE